jgi:hypothetical protein|uniref:Uncharacterized protein n=1 Tax=viral metagenome TaxID=1070528 RepID=A0A6C0AIZ5_9ZZZZ
MDLISSVLAVLLFAAFVPGVLVTLPSKTASKWTVLLVHGVLFAVVTGFVMHYYWTKIKEHMGNYGATCPPGYQMVGPNEDCVAIGGHR